MKKYIPAFVLTAVAIWLICSMVSLSRTLAELRQVSTTRRSGIVLYPAGWPIPQLTVPPGSQRAVAFYGEDSVDEGCTGVKSLADRKVWSVGFHNEWNENDVLRHFYSALRSLGYHYQQVEQGPTIPEWHFYAPDGTYEVRLAHQIRRQSWVLDIHKPVVPDTKFYDGAGEIPAQQ